MRCLLNLLTAWALCVTPAVAETGDKLILGWIEPVRLDRRIAVELEAKLDTGADSSSLDARNIRRVRVGEKRYIRFSIKDPKTGDMIEMRKPYLRRVRIKRHGGDYQRRYVVRMQVCIAGHTQSIDVNLIDREYFDYPMLLGRNVLQGWAMIDPEKARTTQPTCWTGSGDKQVTDTISTSGELPDGTGGAESVQTPDDATVTGGAPNTDTNQNNDGPENDANNPGAPGNT